ncbi:Uncharacterized protein APZ42_005051 [Daphnia magna]|uniref:Uncharacterized protein n=1 Tax=Daphnia magna TaxID=35525 RepID=A0A164GPB5_9CRUS|nr:Uncharacterized protein APZ42_005051 [Daphnia magna]
MQLFIRMSLPEGNKKKGYGVHMDRSVVGGIAAEKDVHINDSVTVCDFYLFLANERQIIQVKK